MAQVVQVLLALLRRTVLPAASQHSEYTQQTLYALSVGRLRRASEARSGHKSHRNAGHTSPQAVSHGTCLKLARLLAKHGQLDRLVELLLLDVPLAEHTGCLLRSESGAAFLEEAELRTVAKGLPSGDVHTLLVRIICDFIFSLIIELNRSLFLRR